jgi:Na+-transporting NADH:ubiquinone oxidoreductase subunit C
MPRDSVLHTFKVALLLCVVCSVVVSAAAIGLRDRQQANKERERKANILAAAGLSDEAAELGVEAVFAQRVVERLLDLESGEFVVDGEIAGFDPRRAARNPDESIPIPADIDAARIGRREQQTLVYLVRGEGEAIDQMVLPIRGYGLWSTLWGFISLDANSLHEGPAGIEIRGLTFYEHAETPGLGGEVDNPRWKEQWREGKRIYDADWNVILQVGKGGGSTGDSQAYRVDGLSGATLTTNGVTYMIQYWFGEHGFRPFLQRLQESPEQLARQQEAGHG